MNFIHYLLQVNLNLILFYGFYRLMLRNETFHHLNRAYLVGSATLAFFIPVLQSSWIGQWIVTQEVSQQIYSYYNPNTIIITAVRPQEPSFTWGHLCAVLYICGIIFFLGKLALQLAHLQRFLNPKRNVKNEAFAFFNFWRVSKDLKDRDTIIAHEKTHVKQLHSADILLFELIAIFNWFNPVVYAYKQSIKNTHEFLADQAAARFHGNVASYAMLLFSQRFGVQPLEITHNFFDKITLKRRIAMLSKPKSTQKALLKYGFIAPLFLAMLVLSSAAISESRGIKRVESAVMSKKPVFENPNTKDSNSTHLAETVVVGYANNNNEKVTFVAPTILRDKPSRRPAEDVYNEVDIRPRFVGGDNEVYRFLAKNLRYPAAAQRANVQGKVFLQFIVQKDGTTTDVEVLKGIGFGCDDEAIRVIELMPKWIPGKIKGQDVNTQMTLPISFLLENNVAQEGEDTTTFLGVVEQQPVFKGGLKAMYKYIKDNVKYPSAAVRANVTGKVFAQFVVGTDGKLTNIKIMKGIGFGCDDEAIRLLKTMPAWVPGKQGGKAVRVNYTLPIYFDFGQNVKYKQGKVLGDENRITLPPPPPPPPSPASPPSPPKPPKPLKAPVKGKDKVGYILDEKLLKAAPDDFKYTFDNHKKEKPYQVYLCK